MSESLRSVYPFAARPTAREWTRHAGLFLLTALTATWAGLSLMAPEIPEPSVAEPAGPFGYLLFVPRYYVGWIASVAYYAYANPSFIADGAKFAASLLSILLAHEAGHYIACRLYGVEATLPFFIPMPPPFMAGTLGAFIKIRSPIPSRRALFDIGVAGPLAGFVVIIPVALLGLLTAAPAPPPAPAPGAVVIAFNDPLLLRLLAWPFGLHDTNLALNPFLIAAWFGLLVTSLNLLPVGQLDGGHAAYAVFGARAHRLLGRAAFAGMVVLAPLGWLWHGVPSGFLYAVLLFVMLRIRHPQATDESDPLGRTRRLVAAATLLVFILSFTPFPLAVK
ncbi:MAG TPA: site-2 protease family protein [Pyrinomonadaceae bacterium]|jgi:membrane-associated protease RseP (regulator of RpoE activity)|nr:site-2 protease family protein [Pyrinomonadaceae bacterium]